ncbi:MAG TPA: DUF167 domain-containing protein [Bryobacteraceae bacterium]|nr:DUF167 domain-containing protein [Bryobacteraceae bacterium]
MKTRLTLKIQAGARDTAFAGRYGDGWKLRISAPPVDGKANHAIIRFLSKLSGVPASAIRIVSGATASTKIIEIAGADPASLDRAILESNGHLSHTGSPAPPEP